MRRVREEDVMIAFEGRSIPGEICFVPKDGLSLFLMFEGKFGEYKSGTAILWLGDGYVEINGGIYVGIRAIRGITPTSSKAF